ncbi:MAG: virulence factor [Candidatus Obscuribacterales bacterium]|nr:virulence factor [Candidatus Obscuribacterales bacterium]
MKLKSVETTPNPNSMKLNLDQQLGSAVTLTKENCADAANWQKELLQINGLQSLFLCADFITLNKDPRADWKPILESATAIVIGQEIVATPSIDQQRKDAESEGQVHVLVQTFRGVPIQIKVTDSEGESRVALGARFTEAAMHIQDETGLDFLAERYWADHGRRYGQREEVADELKEEFEGMFDQAALAAVVAQALGQKPSRELTVEVAGEWLSESDWSRRLAAVTELSRLQGSFDLLQRALSDAHPQVRRLSAAALGASGESRAVQPLCHAMLEDSSVGVRRTAGDALSDIGDFAAHSAMCQALSDANKLVRWRAARFLFDMGDETALPFLETALIDEAFEVRLEAEAAIARIRGGAEGLAPMWKQISNR